MERRLALICLTLAVIFVVATKGQGQRDNPQKFSHRRIQSGPPGGGKFGGRRPPPPGRDPAQRPRRPGPYREGPPPRGPPPSKNQHSQRPGPPPSNNQHQGQSQNQNQGQGPPPQRPQPNQYRPNNDNNRNNNAKPPNNNQYYNNNNPNSQIHPHAQQSPMQSAPNNLNAPVTQPYPQQPLTNPPISEYAPPLNTFKSQQSNGNQNYQQSFNNSKQTITFTVTKKPSGATAINFQIANPGGRGPSTYRPPLSSDYPNAAYSMKEQTPDSSPSDPLVPPPVFYNPAKDVALNKHHPLNQHRNEIVGDPVKDYLGDPKFSQPDPLFHVEEKDDGTDAQTSASNPNLIIAGHSKPSPSASASSSYAQKKEEEAAATAQLLAALGLSKDPLISFDKTNVRGEPLGLSDYLGLPPSKSAQPLYSKPESIVNDQERENSELHPLVENVEDRAPATDSSSFASAFLAQFKKNNERREQVSYITERLRGNNNNGNSNNGAFNANSNSDFGDLYKDGPSGNSYLENRVRPKPTLSEPGSYLEARLKAQAQQNEAAFSNNQPSFSNSNTKFGPSTSSPASLELAEEYDKTDSHQQGLYGPPALSNLYDGQTSASNQQKIGVAPQNSVLLPQGYQEQAQANAQAQQNLAQALERQALQAQIVQLQQAISHQQKQIAANQQLAAQASAQVPQGPVQAPVYPHQQQQQGPQGQGSYEQQQQQIPQESQQQFQQRLNYEQQSQAQAQYGQINPQQYQNQQQSHPQQYQPHPQQNYQNAPQSSYQNQPLQASSSQQVSQSHPNPAYGPGPHPHPHGPPYEHVHDHGHDIGHGPPHGLPPPTPPPQQQVFVVTEAEPIIEIIVQDSNITLPAQQIPLPPPRPQHPPTPEPVHVFYVKYSENKFPHGTDPEINLEQPIPSINVRGPDRNLQVAHNAQDPAFDNSGQASEIQAQVQAQMQAQLQAQIQQQQQSQNYTDEEAQSSQGTTTLRTLINPGANSFSNTKLAVHFDSPPESYPFDMAQYQKQIEAQAAAQAAQYQQQQQQYQQQQQQQNDQFQKRLGVEEFSSLLNQEQDQNEEQQQQKQHQQQQESHQNHYQGHSHGHVHRQEQDKGKELPPDVPAHLKQQLISSGILDHADVQVVNFDENLFKELSSLPPEAISALQAQQNLNQNQNQDYGSYQRELASLQKRHVVSKVYVQKRRPLRKLRKTPRQILLKTEDNGLYRLGKKLEQIA